MRVSFFSEGANIDLSIWTIGRYLKRWGLTPQKPIKKAYEKDPQKVEKWLKEQYPAIKQRAKKEKAKIFWGDEMGILSDHQAGRSYSKAGLTLVIEKTGQRFGCNMISAITNRGKLNFMLFDRKFTANV